MGGSKESISKFLIGTNFQYFNKIYFSNKIHLFEKAWCETNIVFGSIPLWSFVHTDLQSCFQRCFESITNHSFSLDPFRWFANSHRPTKICYGKRYYSSATWSAFPNFDKLTVWSHITAPVVTHKEKSRT